MKSNPANLNPSRMKDLETTTAWSDCMPHREMQPAGFGVSHLEEDWPKGLVKAQDIGRLVAEFAELRALVVETVSDIQKRLSQGEQARPRKRKAKLSSQDASQDFLPILPAELAPISEVIRRSEMIANRPQDPSDDLGLTCSPKTWQRATRILTAHALSVWQNAKAVIRPPVISAGPDGSVDLYWAAAPYGLLLNVPVDPKQPATYFGDDATNPDSNRTCGMLDSTKPIDLGILMWLAHTSQR
jgi:hypothetical protein